ncbi:hypothetical protein ACFX15_027727 [Malus domestica]
MPMISSTKSSYISFLESLFSRRVLNFSVSVSAKSGIGSGNLYSPAALHIWCFSEEKNGEAEPASVGAISSNGIGDDAVDLGANELGLGKAFLGEWDFVVGGNGVGLRNWSGRNPYGAE